MTEHDGFKTLLNRRSRLGRAAISWPPHAPLWSREGSGGKFARYTGRARLGRVRSPSLRRTDDFKRRRGRARASSHRALNMFLPQANTRVFPSSKIALPSARSSTPNAHRVRRASFGRRPSARNPDALTNSMRLCNDAATNALGAANRIHVVLSYRHLFSLLFFEIDHQPRLRRGKTLGPPARTASRVLGVTCPPKNVLVAGPLRVLCADLSPGHSTDGPTSIVGLVAAWGARGEVDRQPRRRTYHI